NPCGCYTSTYLSLDGKQIIDDPSTPPVHTYSVAVQLTAGKTYALAISGASSQLLWGTPSALAPGLAPAVSAAKSAPVGVGGVYRWYDANDVTPLFPFGFGLSYTQFAFSGLSVGRSVVDGTQGVRVSATVTNVGHRAGSEVAQLYLGDPAGAGEPPRQLAD